MTEVVGRRVVDSSGGATSSSRVVAAGDLVFVGGTASGAGGQLATAAVPPVPYAGSVTAQVRYQTDYLFAHYRQGLAEVGCTLDDIAQIEQYITLKRLADGYTQVARGPRYLADPERRPSSFMVRTGPMLPARAVVGTTGFAVHPRTGWERERVAVAPDALGFDAPPGFGHVVVCGPLVLTTVWPSDYRSGVHPDVVVPEWVWWESEIRNEAEWTVRQLRAKLHAAGSSVDDIVSCTLVLDDPADLHEFDLVWRDAVGDTPPARTVLLVPGFGSPRWEGAAGHHQGANRMEIQVRAVRPGHGYDKEVVAGPGTGDSHAARCVRSGPVLWCSQLHPTGAGSAGEQAGEVLDTLTELLAGEGAALDGLYRLRVHGTSLAALAEASGVIAQRTDGQPPLCNYVQAPIDALYPDAHVLVDAVAYAPRGQPR